MAFTLGATTMAVLPPDQFVEFARFVDNAGFSHMFVADSSLHAHDVYPYLTLMALHTSSIQIGPLVTHPYTRHPGINFNAMATINEISGGRLIVNVGAGDRPVMEVGYPIARAKVIREAIRVMRLLQSGERVNFVGENFSLQEAVMRFGQYKGLPFWVTASGPRMLKLAGELADGVVISAGSDLRCIQYALDCVAAGASLAGRSLGDLFLACNINGALDDDINKARDACLPVGAWIPQTAPHYAEIVGVPRERVEAIRKLYGGGHLDEAYEAFKLVTDDMVDAFAVAGNAATWIDRLEQIATLGINLIIVNPKLQDRFGMIRRIAAEVLPHLRGTTSLTHNKISAGP